MGEIHTIFHLTQVGRRSDFKSNFQGVISPLVRLFDPDQNRTLSFLFAAFCFHIVFFCKRRIICEHSCTCDDQWGGGRRSQTHKIKLWEFFLLHLCCFYDCDTILNVKSSLSNSGLTMRYNSVLCAE